MLEEFRKMMVFAVGVVVAAVLLSRHSASIVAADDCGTVTALVSACSSFVANGSPDPIPGSPCCMAMTSLHNLADLGENRRGVCQCMMDLIATYSSNATAIATVPGFCGISLGFPIDPSTDCEYMDQYAERQGR